MNQFELNEMSSDEEELFYFESPVCYNPREECPVLSAKTPQIDKYIRQSGKQPLRFKIERNQRIAATPQPKRFKKMDPLIEENHENNYRFLPSPGISQTPKKIYSYSKKDPDDDLLDRPTNASMYTPERNSLSMSPSAKKNLKKFKTIRTDGTNLIQVLDIVREEFDKIKTDNFQGDLVIILKGITKQTLLEITKKAISQIVLDCGYSPSSMSNVSATIYCEQKANLVTKANLLSTPKQTATQNVHFDEQAPAKTYVTISALSDENAQTVIKGQLLSGYKGIVVFTPVRGKFNSSLMSEYPQKVIDICKLYGYSAKISDSNLQTVECDMRTKCTPKPPPIPKKIKSSTPDAPVKQEIATPRKDSKPAVSQTPKHECPSPAVEKKEQHQEIVKDDVSSFFQEEHVMKVEVPWNSENDAESLIRKALVSDFQGVIRFVPSIGLYSVISMKNYPDRIIEICEEYHLKASYKCGQIIECQKSPVQPISDAKSISLSSLAKKQVEQSVRQQLESGYIGNVQFTSVGQFGARIQEICNEFKFESKQFANNVAVKMVERKCKEIYVTLPLENAKALKHKLQKYLESGYVGPIVFKPQRCDPIKPVIPQFSHIVCDICKIYSCPAKILDSSGSIYATLSPRFVEIRSNSDVEIDRQVRNLLTDFTTGFMIFSLKSDTLDVQKKAEMIVDICKEKGFPAKLADFYYGRVICNSNKNGNKKTESVKGTNNISNVITICLPIYDSKAAEQMIIKQLTNKFTGTVLFAPKNTAYSKTAMPDYPQRIVDICLEHGFVASIINKACQIVECRMKKI